jgi:hypothetical protein
MHASLGFVPLSDLQSGDVHNYAFALQTSGGAPATGDYQQTGVANSGLLYGIDPADPTSATAFLAGGPGHYVVTQGLLSGTNNMGQTSTGDDWLYPCVVFKGREQFKGTTSFLQRPGSSRAILSTYNSLSNVCFGAYVLPWDGVSTPTES